MAKHDEKEHYEELWVQIKDFPQYEVSNYGRVVNIANDRDLTARKGRDGLLYVELRNGNRNQKRHYVHELVAEAFFQQYGPGVQVIHINQDALHDNSVLNLSLRSLLL